MIVTCTIKANPMSSRIFTPRFFFISTAILLAAFSRVLPHPFNFTPIAAMALFGGACLANKRVAFIVPLAAMFISDSILQMISGIGWHNTILYVYASFAVITGIGIYMRNNAKAGNIILASLISSLLFFAVTNFGVWAAGGFENGLAGLAATYLLGVPFHNNDILGSFFFNTIAGDLFWSGVLFGGFYLARLRFPVLAKA
jgi:hypothetical protein